MDPVDLFFRFVGLFYLAAGYLGLRAVLMDSLLDKAIAAITMSPEDHRERRRRQIVGGAAVAIGTGGAALLLMSALALPLFLANLAAQGAWLAGARRLVIPQEDDDPQSMRRLVHAALLYAAATSGVVWLWRDGRLGAWNDPLPAVLVVAAATGLAAYLLHHLSWNPASPDFSRPFDDSDDENPEPQPRRIVIEPERWRHPLVDADTGKRFSHLTWLDDELGWRIEHWDDIFQAAFDPEDSGTLAPAFASPEQEAGYVAEGGAVAEALKALFGEENVSFGPGWNDRGDPEA